MFRTMPGRAQDEKHKNKKDCRSKLSYLQHIQRAMAVLLVINILKDIAGDSALSRKICIVPGMLPWSAHIFDSNFLMRRVQTLIFSVWVYN